MKIDSSEIYNNIRTGKIKFDEETHCKLILEIMSNPSKGRMSSFCVQVGICERKFYVWLKESEVFQFCYELGKQYARENWEIEGEELKDFTTMPGTNSTKFEYWRMIGWSRFGVGKNSRIRLDLNAEDSPDKHYSQLLKQASQGDFTAGEIKQLMEAINVGLSTHQSIKLQKEIDQLKSDLVTMSNNTNVHDSLADKRTKKED